MELEYYLMLLQEDLLDESKWKQMIQQFKVHPKDVQRIQQYIGNPDPYYVKQLMKSGLKGQKQARKYLLKRKIFLSPGKWLAGVERGNRKIMKQKGIELRHYSTGASGVKPGEEIDHLLRSHSSYDIHTKTGKIYLPRNKNISNKDKLLASIIKRHEIDEVREGMRKHKYAGRRAAYYNIPVYSSMGDHATEEVLRREFEHVYFATLFYPKQASRLWSLRSKSEEYKNIIDKGSKSKKEINKEIIKKIKDFRKRIDEEIINMRKQPYDVRLRSFLKGVLKALRDNSIPRKTKSRIIRKNAALYGLEKDYDDIMKGLYKKLKESGIKVKKV